MRKNSWYFTKFVKNTYLGSIIFSLNRICYVLVQLKLYGKQFLMKLGYASQYCAMSLLHAQRTKKSQCLLND